MIDKTGTIWADSENQQLLLKKYRYPEGASHISVRMYQSYQDSLGQQMHLVSVPIKHTGIMRGAVISAVPEEVIGVDQLLQALLDTITVHKSPAEVMERLELRRYGDQYRRERS